MVDIREGIRSRVYGKKKVSSKKKRMMERGEEIVLFLWRELRFLVC